MKRLLSIVFATALLFSRLNAAAATVAVSSSSGAEGESITLALSFRGMGELSAVSINIEYDYTKLAYISFIKGNGLSADYCRVRHLDDGKLRLSFTDTQSNYTADGPVIYLKFKITDGQTGRAIVAPIKSAGAIFDGNYVELDYTTEEGVITILPPFPTTPLTVSEGLIHLDKPHSVDSLSDLLGNGISVEQADGVIGSGCPVRYLGELYYTVLKGDTNGDGLFGTADYLRLSGFLCGAFPLTHPFIAACDMDDNGIHSTADALALKNILINPN